MQINYKSPRLKLPSIEKTSVKAISSTTMVQACIQTSFCLLIAGDCMNELYDTELKNNPLIKTYLLECRQTIQDLWKSIKTHKQEYHDFVMIETGDVVDDYEDELTEAFEKMQISSEKWNNLVVKYYGAYTFLISASTAIQALYGSQNRQFKKAIDLLIELHKIAIQPILDENGISKKVKDINYVKPLIDFLYNTIEPATINIANNILKYQKKQ